MPVLPIGGCVRGVGCATHDGVRSVDAPFELIAIEVGPPMFPLLGRIWTERQRNLLR